MNMKGATKSTMQRLLSVMALLSSGVCSAQTYYYIDGITVSPGSPTTSDAITIMVSGSLSSTASLVTSATAMVVGNNVQLTITAAQQGIGLDILVPHSESMPIGMLAAGTYAISITGAGSWDLAPAVQHQFTVTGGAGSACDSITLSGPLWSAFDDEQLVITTTNSSSDLFSYPGFVLLSSDGDTIAKEEVYFIGLSANAQVHSLEVIATGLGSAPITGTLQLWSGFYSELECEWEGTWNPCPPAPCVEVTPYLVNFGNSMVDATVPYALINSLGAAVSSGEFQLQDSAQIDQDTTCLPPGNYTLLCEGITPVGGQLYFGISVGPDMAQTGQSSYFQDGTDQLIAFDLYGLCAEDADGLFEESVLGELVIETGTVDIRLRSVQGKTLGQVNVLDAIGRLMLSARTNASELLIPSGDWSSGVYIAVVPDHRTVRFAR